MPENPPSLTPGVTPAPLPAPAQDKNLVSYGFWMLMPLVLMIPCVNLVMVIVWAFSGENQSRRNYFKAMLTWMGIMLVLYIGIALVALMIGVPIMSQIWETIQREIERQAQQPRP